MILFYLFYCNFELLFVSLQMINDMLLHARWLSFATSTAATKHIIYTLTEI